MWLTRLETGAMWVKEMGLDRRLEAREYGDTSGAVHVYKYECLLTKCYLRALNYPPMGNNNSERFMAQALLWSHVMKYVDSMCLKCAVELGIPQAIHNHGKPITIDDLLASLSISPSRKAHMYRLMRILSHSGIFTKVQSDDQGEDAFSLTPVSTLLVKDHDLNLCDFALLLGHPVMVDPFHQMSAWFKSKESLTPFHMLNGCSFWEMTEMNSEFNTLFNAAMASDAKFVMDVLLEEHGHVLAGVQRLVDVGGGTGSAALAISKMFPNISCTVLDLQQVVHTVKEEDKKLVQFAVGDMFEFIPPADAIFLKCILRDWKNEECVKILKRCREAILCNENGGKVIIIDQVVCLNKSNENSRKVDLRFDMTMMVALDAAERNEEEWSEIFTQAEFKRYTILSAFGNRCIIELFP